MFKLGLAFLISKALAQDDSVDEIDPIKIPESEIKKEPKVFYEFNLSNNEKTWDGANNSCMMWGGSLVSIHSHKD